MQDATGNAADIAAAWAIGCGAPFAFGEHLKATGLGMALDLWSTRSFSCELSL